MSTRFLSYLDSLTFEQQKNILLRLLPECSEQIEIDYPAPPMTHVEAAKVVPEKPKKPSRKATTTKTKADLLRPVDADVDVVPAAAEAPVVVPAPAEAPVVVPAPAEAPVAVPVPAEALVAVPVPAEALVVVPALVPKPAPAQKPTLTGQQIKDRLWRVLGKPEKVGTKSTPAKYGTNNADILATVERLEAEAAAKGHVAAPSIPVPLPAVVPAPAPSVTTIAPVSSIGEDPLRNHPSRLQQLDTTRCMGRKVNIMNHVRGTAKEEGGTQKFYYEKQCLSKPVAGCTLCDQCAKNEAEVATGKNPYPRKWFGRLDAPLYEFAMVVGCNEYLKVYPDGIRNDPASIVTTNIVAPPTETYEEEWITCTYQHRPVVINTTTHFVFELNPTSTSTKTLAQLDKPIGRAYDAKDTAPATEILTVRGTRKTIDPYDLPE